MAPMVPGRRREVEVSLLRPAISARDGSNAGVRHGAWPTRRSAARAHPARRAGLGQQLDRVVDDDPTPLSEHRTRSEAEAAARVHAETFGYPEILVYDNDGNQSTIIVDDVDPLPGYPGAAPGDSAS